MNDRCKLCKKKDTLLGLDGRDLCIDCALRQNIIQNTNIKIFTDGDSLCVTDQNFIDLQESPAYFLNQVEEIQIRNIVNKLNYDANNQPN